MDWDVLSDQEFPLIKLAKKLKGSFEEGNLENLLDIVSIN